MNPDNQLQRGCQSCGEVEWHSADCRYNLRPPSRATAVIDAERIEAEGEVPRDKATNTIWTSPDATFVWAHGISPPSDSTAIEYRRVKTCEWAYDGVDDKWDTECGESWQLTDGDPKHNRMHYCHRCGGTLVVRPTSS